MTWFEKFIAGLERLILYPPYLIFLFIGTVIFIVALIARAYVNEIGIFLLYAVAGSMWRYIERDFLSVLSQYRFSKIVIISIYHLGNIFLFGALICLLWP